MCDEGCGSGPARAQGGFCGLVKSLEPSSLEKDVGNLTAKAASFTAREQRRRGGACGEVVRILSKWQKDPTPTRTTGGRQ